MTPRKKYLLIPKLSITHLPAWLPSLGQTFLSTEKTYKVAHLTTDCCWHTNIFNLLARVSARFYLGLYIRGQTHTKYLTTGRNQYNLTYISSHGEERAQIHDVNKHLWWILLSLGKLFDWKKLFENIRYSFRYSVPKSDQNKPTYSFRIRNKYLF